MNEIHIWTLELLHGLARLGRQALHVFTVALGVERIESQSGFARARHPCDYDQLVARNLNLDILKVVLASAFNVYMMGPFQCSAMLSGPITGVSSQKVNL